MTSTAHGDVHEKGKVFVDGALWEARSESPIRAGAPVEVVGVEGLRLVVKERS